MNIRVSGWSRNCGTRLISDLDLSDHTSNLSNTYWDKANIMVNDNSVELRFRASIPRGTTMGGDYLFRQEFTALDLATLLWAVLNWNGVGNFLGGLVRLAKLDPGVTQA